MQIPADQLDRAVVSRVDLQSVLSTEEDVCFTANIAPFGTSRGSLAKVLQLPGDPRCSMLNACVDLSQAPVFGRFHFYCQVRTHADGQTLGFGAY